MARVAIAAIAGAIVGGTLVILARWRVVELAVQNVVVCNDIPAHMTRSLRKAQPLLRGAEDESERARTPLSSETGGSASLTSCSRRPGP